MKRSKKHLMVATPLLTDNLSTSARFAFGDIDQSNEVFAPSPLRKNQKAKSESSNRMFAAILFGLFIVVLLFTFLFGINVYQSLNTLAESESTQRVEQSFLANVIHSNDIHHAIRVGEGPEGRSLVFFESVEGAGNYETRLYSYRGSIVYEYALAGTPYAPEKALELFESELFDFSYSDNLLTINTDSGSVDIALRSEEGAAR